MKQAANQLFSMGSVYLALAVVIITFFARRIVETGVPTANKNHKPETGFGHWWNGVILYAIPVVAGSLLAIAAWKSGTGVLEAKTTGGAVIHGGTVGWFSSFIYKVFRKYLKQRTGIDPVPGPASVTEPEDDDEDDED